MASKKYRTEAWIVGKHALPDDLPPVSVLGLCRLGDVIVRAGTHWTVMCREDFDRDYAWIEE